MAYDHPEIRTFAGVYKQANSFGVPDGAFEDLDNFQITEDQIAAKRRGFYEYFDPSSDTLRHLINYNNRLLAIFSDNSAYFTDTGTDPNKTGSRTNHTGEAIVVPDTRRPQDAKANKNLYVTTENGVIKLASFDGKRFKAGVPPGLDLRGTFLAANGPILAETQVGYRVIFGRRDENDNLLLSAPSDILVLTNSKVEGASFTNPAGTTARIATTVDHNLAVGMNFTVSNSSDATMDGLQTITAIIDSKTFEYDQGAAFTAPGTLDYTATRQSRLEISVPSEIDDAADGYFYQLYRTTQTGDSTVSPTANFKLLTEQEITAAQITAGVAFFNDNLPDLLLGAELYTNPNSREGELQANDRPPLVEDVDIYKGHLIYANATTRHTMGLDVIDTSVISAGDFIETRITSTVRKYVARIGVGNKTTKAESVSGTGTITITSTAHGLSTGDVILASRITGTLTFGEYAITVTGANTFTITAAGLSATDLDFQGVRDTSGDGIFYLDKSSTSVSVQLRETAQALVKAINRDTSSLIYARYTSTITGVPGKTQLSSKGFGDKIELRANTTAVGGAFDPILPAAFGDVFSRNQDQSDRFYSSKIQEPEAVPLLNNFPVGRGDKDILRVFALKDSLIILKEDGVFRMTGDLVVNFAITTLDNTIGAINPALAVRLNNEVIFLSTEGWVLVTENSVRIISRRIENDVQPTLTVAETKTIGGAVGYESERLFLGSTLKPNGTTVETTHCFNPLNGSWSTWNDVLFTAGVVGPSDTLYLVSVGNKLLRERKFHTKIDYCGQNYATTVVSVSSDKKSAVITSASAPPRIGDIVVEDDVINRITAVSLVSGSDYNVTFLRESNINAADTPILYYSYKSTFKLAPFHAGQVGRSKLFSQQSIHLRNTSVTRAKLNFSNEHFAIALETCWEVNKVVTGGLDGGWGTQPWGLFPWGNAETTALPGGTEPSPIIRTYVPQFTARGTYIQSIFEHEEAGEPINIQAIAFSVQGYGERVSR